MQYLRQGRIVVLQQREIVVVEGADVVLRSGVRHIKEVPRAGLAAVEGQLQMSRVHVVQQANAPALYPEIQKIFVLAYFLAQDPPLVALQALDILKQLLVLLLPPALSVLLLSAGRRGLRLKVLNFCY